eukprot:scaffold256_cov121-Isochrysis_galbana.AAC.1
MRLPIEPTAGDFSAASRAKLLRRAFWLGLPLRRRPSATLAPLRPPGMPASSRSDPCAAACGALSLLSPAVHTGAGAAGRSCCSSTC